MAKRDFEHRYHHVNPQNGEIAYSMGAMYLDEGHYEKANKACMNTCLESDDCDVDPMMVVARQGG
jgi:hypothetical protein